MIVSPPRMSSFDWICEHACNKRGMPFDYLSYPWTKGICEAVGQPARERIFFQAGSRLGKTELGLSLLECGMATAPDIAMIGGPTGDKVEQWIKDRLIPMIENCLPLRRWLPPPHRRPKDTLHLRHGTIYGAWSGSPTTLGDLDPRYLLGFGDRQVHQVVSSEEADSLMLLLGAWRRDPQPLRLLREHADGLRQEPHRQVRPPGHQLPVPCALPCSADGSSSSSWVAGKPSDLV